MAKGNYIFLSSRFGETCDIRAYECNGECVGAIVFKESDKYPRYKHLCNGTNLLEITRVVTKTTYTNRGIASALISRVIWSFKTYNIVLLCSPQKREGNFDTLKSVTDLKKFYEKFGFKKTGELLPTMIRKATLPTLGV